MTLSEDVSTSTVQQKAVYSWLKQATMVITCDSDRHPALLTNYEHHGDPICCVKSFSLQPWYVYVRSDLHV